MIRDIASETRGFETKYMIFKREYSNDEIFISNKEHFLKRKI